MTGPLNKDKRDGGRDPRVSVIISSLDGRRGGNVRALLDQLTAQTYPEFEVLLVVAAAPCALAHNVGAGAARGEILVFFDDDVVLGNEKVLDNLVAALDSRKGIGLAGTSQILPDQADDFQKRCAAELSRATFDIVEDARETDMVTHAGLAMTKGLYERIGGELETLRRNDDLYLRKQVADLGLKAVVVARTWVHHPLPSSLRQLARKRYADGVLIAGDYKMHPEHVYYSPVDAHEVVRESSLAQQVARNLKMVLRAIRRFHVIALTERIAMQLGFVNGWLHSKNWHENRWREIRSEGRVIRRLKTGSEMLENTGNDAAAG